MLLAQNAVEKVQGGSGEGVGGGRSLEDDLDRRDRREDVVLP